jgi:hypothetical protein
MYHACIHWYTLYRYSCPQSSENKKEEKGRVICCGLEIEADTGEDAKGRACFTIKGRSGSTTRRIELACDNTGERHCWVKQLALQAQQTPEGQMENEEEEEETGKIRQVFARVMCQVRLHAGASPRVLTHSRLRRTL